jgi:hypothetical protein
VTEQLALDEGLGDGCAVDGHEGLAPPVGQVVDGSRHELLAGAALAEDQDRGGAGGGQLDPPVDLVHALGLAHQLTEAALLAQLVPEEVDLAGERFLLDRLLQQHLKPGGVHRLGEVVEGAVSHGLHGALHRGMPRHQQHGRRAARLPELLEQRQAVHLRQHQIGHDDGRVLTLHEIERFLAGGSRLHLVAPLTDEAGQPLTLGRLVVDDEDLAVLRLVAARRSHDPSRDSPAVMVYPSPPRTTRGRPPPPPCRMTLTMSADPYRCF